MSEKQDTPNISTAKKIDSIITRLKQIRDHFGISQAELARALGKTVGFVSLVETGRRKLSEEDISILCKLYSVNREWLISGSGEMLSVERAKADKTAAGQRIKLVRKGANLSMADFGKHVGCSTSQISRVEAGETTPSNKFLHSVADAFDIRYDWLLTGEGDMEEKNPPVDDEVVNWLNAHPSELRNIRKKMREGKNCENRENRENRENCSSGETLDFRNKYFNACA